MTERDPALRRIVSLPWLVLYGLGTTVGAGIYALTGEVAGRSGLLAPMAFLLASLIALPTALSFAELSSRYPLAGGEAVYVREGLRSRRLSVLVGLLMVVAGLVSAATVSVGFAGYLGAVVPVPRLPAIVLAVIGIGAVAAWGVRESVVAAGVMTVIEVGGLLAVIGFGAEHLAALPPRSAEFVPPDLSSWQTVAATAILCFYAFLGFEDMVNVAEEVRDVRRVLPVAILLTLGITAVLYVLLSTVAVLAVPPEELARSQAPLSLVFERCGGPPQLLGVVALFALLNGALIQVMKSARVLYGLACQGSLPAWLARVHPRRRTPLHATALSTAGALLAAVVLPLGVLAETTAVVTLGTFTLANLSLVWLKRREPHPPDAVTCPIWVPAVGAAVSFAFVLFEGLQRAL